MVYCVMHYIVCSGGYTIYHLHPIDNSDYVLETQQLQLGTSMLTSEVVIQVIDDDVIEADEEFILTISEITPDGMISSNSFSVNFKIIDNDGTLTPRLHGFF